MTLFYPREHGAWGILLVPFSAAAAIAGMFDAAVAVALAAVVLAFLVRAPLEFLLLPGGRPHPPTLTPAVARRSATVFGAGALAAGLALVVGWRLAAWLLPLAGLALALFLLHLWQARRRAARSWTAELLGTVALTMSAPVAWVAATGGLDSTGLLVWLLNAAFFCAGLVYVKSRIRSVTAARTPASAADTARLVWEFHLGLILFVSGLTLFDWLPPLVILPFGLAAARAAWGVRRFGQRFAVRQLGWKEVAHSLVFAVLLVAAFRW